MKKPFIYDRDNKPKLFRNFRNNTRECKYVNVPQYSRCSFVKEPVSRGRGYSLCELKEAGICLQNLNKYDIDIDLRRNSCWNENIYTLKNLNK